MSFYSKQVLPRITEIALRGPEFARVRERVASGLSGEVLEVGFGSGLNVPHYPNAVRRVQAVDPATVGRRLASRRIAACAVPVEYLGLDGQDLPLETASIDHLLITWTMCTIPDIERALKEFHRVLRPGGELHFVEHGRSPDANVSRWQDRMTPLQRRIFGGCHLNRPIDRLILEANFDIARMNNFYMKGPKAMAYMFEGVASKRN